MHSRCVTIQNGKDRLTDIEIVTNGTIYCQNIADIIGSYTLESTPYGHIWVPDYFDVTESDFTAENNYTHTIYFEALYTLPVELSSFTAVLTSDLFVNVAWTSESETNHAGYNVLRSEVRELSTTLLINNGMIDQGTATGTQMNYLFTDTEVGNQLTYYYWLESISLDGISAYYGPLMVTISNGGEQPEVPSIPLETKLFSAFPNPFNPSTNMRYSMKDAGDARLEIYNTKGQLIKSYQTSHSQAGYYQINWDGHDTNGQLAGTGVYFYRMTSGKYTATKKMVLAK